MAVNPAGGSATAAQRCCLGIGEVIEDELLEDLDALVRVLDRLDAVADAHHELLLVAHLIEELLRWLHAHHSYFTPS